MYLNIESNLQNGDMVEVVGLPFPRHVGIYAGGRGVVHNQKSCCVVLTDMAGFSGGRPVRNSGVQPSAGWQTACYRFPSDLHSSMTCLDKKIIRQGTGGNPEMQLRAWARTGCAVKDFRELKVWQKAHQLTLAVYQLTATFPREELYGLSAQLRRAGSSIAANLAEGCGRNGDAELARFCSMAMGSASELKYHLLLARDLKLIPSKDYQVLHELATELKRMLTALMQKLNADC